MGLDKDDEIVKRRMAQKMQFLAEDVAAAREPTTAELEAGSRRTAPSSAQPPRLSFRHLYFSPDRRGARARRCAQALAKLAGQPVDAKLASALADPFMFQDYYRDRAPDYLGKEFGPVFALAVASLRTRLVAGADRVRLRLAPGVRRHVYSRPRAGLRGGRVRCEDSVAGEQKAQAWEKAYKAMRANYTVLLPAPPERFATASSAPMSNAPAATGGVPK